MFSVPDGESGQICGVLEAEGTSMVPGLIPECSYPWALEPAGRNG